MIQRKRTLGSTFDIRGAQKHGQGKEITVIYDRGIKICSKHQWKLSILVQITARSKVDHSIIIKGHQQYSSPCLQQICIGLNYISKYCITCYNHWKGPCTTANPFRHTLHVCVSILVLYRSVTWTSFFFFFQYTTFINKCYYTYNTNSTMTTVLAKQY